MIIILKRAATDEEIAEVSAKLEEHGYTPNVTRGVEDTIIAAIGTPEPRRKRNGRAAVASVAASRKSFVRLEIV